MQAVQRRDLGVQASRARFPVRFGSFVGRKLHAFTFGINFMLGCVSTGSACVCGVLRTSTWPQRTRSPPTAVQIWSFVAQLGMVRSPSIPGVGWDTRATVGCATARGPSRGWPGSSASAAPRSGGGSAAPDLSFSGVGGFGFRK